MSKPKTKSKKPPDLHQWRIDNPNAKRPGHTKKDYRLLVQAAWAAGWKVEKRKKYIHCTPLDPEADIVKIAMTPSSSRTLENTKASLRAAGLDV
jgi:hypothetical protein